jgi:integrase
MAIKLPSHLHRSRSGILHFRIAIPPDLRHHFASREIYRSLSTASVRDAALAAQTLSNDLKRVFTAIRQQSMSDPNKSPQDPLTIFSNLPDVRARIKQAGIQVRLREQEIALEQAEEMLADSAERLALASVQHERELAALVMSVASASAAVAPVSFAAETPLVSEAVADMARMKRAQGRWEEKTEEDYMSVYNLFIRIIGDMPIADIDDDIIVSYLETLKRLPANMNKSPAYIGKNIAEILSLAPPPMAARTINKNIERVSALFKWALNKKKYGVIRNPAASMGVDESDSAKRLPFTKSELISLFSSIEFESRQFENVYAYWLMPLGLLTGARLGELSQLYLTDFVEQGGIHCINISDEEEGQRVKNKNAKRLVPIHDKLIELGLLQYVGNLRKNGETRLFPELNQRRDGFAQAASTWFGRYKERCGIMEKHTKVFHSFRHNFISALLDDDISEQSVAQIVGHEGKLITSLVYWNAKDAAKRKPTVDSYQPHPDLWSLTPKFCDVTTGSRPTKKHRKTS